MLQNKLLSGCSSSLLALRLGSGSCFGRLSAHALPKSHRLEWLRRLTGTLSADAACCALPSARSPETTIPLKAM